MSSPCHYRTGGGCSTGDVGGYSRPSESPCFGAHGEHGIGVGGQVDGAVRNPVGSVLGGVHSHDACRDRTGHENGHGDVAFGRAEVDGGPGSSSGSRKASGGGGGSRRRGNRCPAKGAGYRYVLGSTGSGGDSSCDGKGCARGVHPFYHYAVLGHKGGVLWLMSALRRSDTPRQYVVRCPWLCGSGSVWYQRVGLLDAQRLGRRQVPSPKPFGRCSRRRRA